MITLKTVAILLATYNGGKYLPELLNSLSKQTYAHFTLYVRDDCSTDDTINIVNSFNSSIDIIVLPITERLGPAKSFVELLKNTGGHFDYYSFADQDDYWEENKLERAVNFLSRSGNEPTLYCSSLEYVNENLDHLAYPYKPRFIGLENALVENIATGCTIVINKPAKDLILSSLPRFYSMHDWWFYIVISAFGKVIYDETPTIKYRQHSNNAIGATTNPIQSFYRKLKRFLKKENGVFTIYAQAVEFKHCFSNKFSPTQSEIVELMLSGKTRFVNKLTLCFLSPFVRQKPMDTLILRLLFLIDRF